MDIIVTDGIASLVRKDPPKPRAPVNSVRYKLRISAGETILFKRDVPDDFLMHIPYFRGLINGGMTEVATRTISIKLDFLTKTGVEQYLTWRTWIYGGCVGEPVLEHEPSAAMLAEYLSDTDYFNPMFTGAKISIFELQSELIQAPPDDERYSKHGFPYYSYTYSPDMYIYDRDGKIHPYYQAKPRTREHLYTIEIPAGIYGTEIESKAIISELIKDKIREVLTDVDVIECDDKFSIETDRELVVECSGSIKHKVSQSTFVPIFTHRKYTMVIRDDYPQGLPEVVASYLAEQYFKTAVRLKANSYRKLARFVSDKPALAKVIWIDNRDAVVSMLRLPKSSHSKIAKMDFDKIFAYADSVARSREDVVYDFSSDSQLSQIEAKMRELEIRFDSVKDTYYRLKLSCGDLGFDRVEHTYDLMGGENPVELANKLDILEREWETRYNVLAANKRKNMPLNRPNVYKYYSKH